MTRDIGGADPERMTPLATARYLAELFRGSEVSVRVVEDAETIARDYPLMGAVNRAAATVDRHRGMTYLHTHTRHTQTHTHRMGVSAQTHAHTLHKYNNIYTSIL